MKIDDISNLSKIAIIVIGYNRLECTGKLLNSLNEAFYPVEEVPLVISIDKSGNKALYDYVKDFYWKYGEKYVFIREERLGLQRHIFECGNLSIHFKAVILLEDDVIVAPDYYNYFISAVNRYGEYNQVACISAYSNYLNGYVGLPFFPMVNHDVFAIQEVSSTGECFTSRMWNEFINWKTVHTPFDFTPLDMPEKIKRWKEAWTKYYNAYMVLEDKYCVYPCFSTITNTGAAGVHSVHSETVVQTVLMTGRRKWDMPKFDDLVKYDIYTNNICLYKTLGYKQNELCLDMYGHNPNYLGKRYVLTTKRLPYKIIKGFELSYRPHELNIEYNNPGDDVRLYDTSIKTVKNGGRFNNELINYYLYGFNVKSLPYFSICKILEILKQKCKKKLQS